MCKFMGFNQMINIFWLESLMTQPLALMRHRSIVLSINLYNLIVISKLDQEVLLNKNP